MLLTALWLLPTAMTLDVLLNVHNEVRKSKSKTLNNYPIKKFHLNTFMNVVSCGHSTTLADALANHSELTPLRLWTR